MKQITKLNPDPGAKSYDLVNDAGNDIYISRGVNYLPQTTYHIGLQLSTWSNPYPKYYLDNFQCDVPRKPLTAMRFRSEYGTIIFPNSNRGEYEVNSPQKFWDNAHYIVDLGEDNHVDPIDWAIDSVFEFDVVQGEFQNWICNPPSVDFGVVYNSQWIPIGSISGISWEDARFTVGKDLVLRVGRPS